MLCYKQLHVVLYVAIVSGIVDAFAAASGATMWGDFWGTLSPYTVLYTAGRCLARLAQGGVVVHGVIFVYIVLRSPLRLAISQPRLAITHVQAGLYFSTR